MLQVQPLQPQGNTLSVALPPTPPALGMASPSSSPSVNITPPTSAQPLTVQQPPQQQINSIGTIDNQQPYTPPISDDLKSKIVTMIQHNRGKYSDGQILNGLVSDNKDIHPEVANQIQSWMGSPLDGSQRTDRNNNPIAAAVKTNGTNDFTKALDSQGIKWTYGDQFPGDTSMSTIKILGDPLQAAKTILSSTSSIESWYGNHTGKSILDQYGIKNNSDFQKANPDVQNAIVQGIYNAENGTKDKPIPTGYDPKTILDGLVVDNKIAPNASNDISKQPSSELFRSAFATGVRNIEATPQIAKAVYQAAVDPAVWGLLFHNPLEFLRQGLSNNPDSNSTVGQAQQTMDAPLAGANTLSGESNEQRIGQAGEALSYLPTPMSSLLRGATFGASNAMENNASPTDTAIQAGESAALFKGLDIAAPFIGKALGAVVPQGLQDMASSGLSKINSLLGQAGEAINPTLSKVVPGFISSNKNVIQQGAEKIFGKQFIQSNVDSWNEIFSGTKSAKKNLLTSLDRDKDPAGFLGSRGIMPSIDTSSGTPKWNAQPAIAKIETLATPYNEAVSSITKAKDALMGEGDMIILDDLASQTKKAIDTSVNRGAGNLPAMQADIDNEVANLKSIYGDKINASQLDEIRKGQWSASSSFKRMPNPATPFKGDVHFQLGSVARNIEGKVLPEVEPLLGTLSDHYDAINNLSKIDGNAVRNGKPFLQKMSNKLVGALIGSIGGPIGAVAGDIAGGFATDMFNNFTLNNPLKVAVLQSIPPDSAIYDAAQEALQRMQGAEAGFRASQAPLQLSAPAEGSAKFGGGEAIPMPTKVIGNPDIGEIKRIGGKGSRRTININNLEEGQISAPKIKRGSYKNLQNYKARYLQKVIDDSKKVTSK